MLLCSMVAGFTTMFLVMYYYTPTTLWCLTLPPRWCILWYVMPSSVSFHFSCWSISFHFICVWTTASNTDTYGDSCSLIVYEKKKVSFYSTINSTINWSALQCTRRRLASTPLSTKVLQWIFVYHSLRWNIEYSSDNVNITALKCFTYNLVSV